MTGVQTCALPISESLLWLTLGKGPFLLHGAVTFLANSKITSIQTLDLLRDEQNNMRLAVVLASRKRFPKESKIVKVALIDKSPSVRRAAVQWVAEENLKDLRPQVEAILDSKSMTTDLFLATLAALEMLDGKDPKDFDKTPAGKYVLPLVKDEKRSPAVRAQALRLVDRKSVV